jgi:type II secretory pathway pseudopilin PulG
MKFLRNRVCEQKSISPIRTRGGFTLLETLIAVALLMVATVIVYQGFSSTLQYSSNTAQFAKSAQIADKSVKQGISAGDTMGAVAPDGSIVISGSYGAGLFSQPLAVKEYSSKPIPVVIVGNVDYQESDFNSVNRHGFSYAGRLCPVCNTPLQWYEDGGKYYAFCSKSTCNWDEKINPIPY